MYVPVWSTNLIVRKLPMTGALPAAYRTFEICWAVAVPVSPEWRQTRLFMQTSAERPVTIGGTREPFPPARPLRRVK